MRRFARMVTVLAVLAMMVGSVINAAHATGMAMHMAAAHADGAMPGCDDCPGGGGAGMGCVSGCMTLLTAIIPAAPPIAATSTLAFAGSGAQKLVGHSRPPNPYPPRTTVLG